MFWNLHRFCITPDHLFCNHPRVVAAKYTVETFFLVVGIFSQQLFVTSVDASSRGDG